MLLDAADRRQAEEEMKGLHGGTQPMYELTRAIQM
jgi:hypothetical protein